MRCVEEVESFKSKLKFNPLGDQEIFERREVDIVKLGNRKWRKAHVRDVHEGIEARARLRDDVAAKRREIVGTRVARRDAGRGALMGDELVRRDTYR